MVGLLQLFVPGQLPLDFGVHANGLLLLLFHHCLGPPSLGSGLHEMLAAALRTAHMRAGIEDGEDGGIHLDDLVVLFEDRLVSNCNHTFYPSFKRLPHKSVDHVHDILSRQLLDLLLDWESLGNLWVISSELEEVGDGEAGELWHVEHLHGLGFDEAFLTTSNITKVPDRRGIAMRKVSSNLRREKSMHLPLGLELCCESRSRELVVRLHVVFTWRIRLVGFEFLL